MRRLALLAALLLICCGSADAAISLVQHANKDTSGASTTLAYTSNVSANNLLVVVVRSGNDSGSTITVTDSIGNTWTKCALNMVVGVGSTQLSYAVASSSAADTVTVTLNSSATMRMAIYEYSGTAATSPLDTQANAATGSSTAPASASFTPTANNELVIAFAATNSGDSYSAGTNYTLEDNPGSKLGVEIWVQGTAAATTGNFTLSPSDSWLAGYAVFKPAGGGGSGGSPHSLPTMGCCMK